MSWISNAHSEQPSYLGPNHSTVAAIQKKIVKEGDRSPISRFFRAKSDKDAIAAWGQDLDRILHIFNVRPVIHVR